MTNLLDTPSFTANEIYAIQATDKVEGAATGASFGGIGLSNQPHQQLANRTAMLKQRQDVNIANISALQNFVAMFRGVMAPNGYLTIPFLDVNRGMLTAYVQWGAMFPQGGLVGDATWTISWPIAFPNACSFALASLSNAQANVNAGEIVMETVSFTKTQGVFMSDFNGANQPRSYASLNDGFYYIAIGF